MNRIDRIGTLDKHRDMVLLHEKLTGKILEACFEVSNKLGSGFPEKVYENSLLQAMREKGLKAEPQVPLDMVFREVTVGEYYADIIAEEKVIVVIKAA
jgi:GxxExxY protein